MRVPAKPQKTTERVVVLLKPSEKKRLARLAEAEQVSAAEILRRSLEAYVPEDAGQEKRLLHQLNAALDHTLASIAETHGRVTETLGRLESQRVSPEVDALLNELFQQADAGQAHQSGKARKRRAA